MNERPRHRRYVPILLLAGALVLPAASRGQIIFSNNTVFLSNVTQTAASSTNYFLGKVGIGTNNPSAKLHVAGDMTVSGALQVPRQGDVGMGPYTNGLATGGASSASGVTTSNVCFEVYKTNVQSVANSTYVKVVWGKVALNAGGGFNLTNNAFAPPVTGWYVFNAATRLDFDAGVAMRTAIYVGTSVWRETRYLANGASNYSQTVTAGPIYLTTNDSVSLYVWHGSAGGRGRRAEG